MEKKNPHWFIMFKLCGYRECSGSYPYERRFSADFDEMMFYDCMRGTMKNVFNLTF